MRVYFRMAAAHGLIESEPELRLALERHTTCHATARRAREVSHG